MAPHFYLDKPEILGEQTYVEKDDGIQMELVCIVHGSPAPEVSWTRDGHPITRWVVFLKDKNIFFWFVMEYGAKFKTFPLIDAGQSAQGPPRSAENTC